MNRTPESAAFDRSTEPLFRLLTARQVEQIVSFRPDESVLERIDVLAAKCAEGELTPEERAEYEGYVRANSVIALMQGIARKRLADRKPA